MTKTKPQVVIVNCTTNEQIVRDANEQELAQAKIDLDNYKADKAQAEAKTAARQAILDRLGLTADEAQLLLGGN